jgi:hypothetical protein
MEIVISMMTGISGDTEVPCSSRKPAKDDFWRAFFLPEKVPSTWLWIAQFTRSFDRSVKEWVTIVPQTLIGL